MKYLLWLERHTEFLLQQKQIPRNSSGLRIKSIPVLDVIYFVNLGHYVLSNRTVKIMLPAKAKAVYALLLFSLLTACASSVKPPAASAPAASRYSIQQDRAPARIVDPAAIPEVIPEPIQRTLAGNRSPYTVLGKTYFVMPTEEGYSERGVASWYGEKFHGHKTSNGEVFDMYLASAAHKSLPIPSFLRVTNLDNNRSIIVRVNDRGPFHGDRLIDLSYGAALQLDYAERGTARVQLEAIVPAGIYTDRALSESSTSSAPLLAATANASGKYLQVGAFAELATAQEITDQLRGITGYPVFIRSVKSGEAGMLHRVRVGPFNNQADIVQTSERVVAANLGRPYTVTE